MLRWLHISDLHIKEKADWNNFKEELFVECKQIGKIDFVIVTGDFHNYTDGDCFKQAIEFLRNLIKELNLNILEDLFLILGNHDGVTNIKDKDTFVSAAKYKPLNISLDCLNRLLDMFQDYDLFVKTLIPDYPVEQPSAIHIRTWHDKIALIHCNTALAADGKEKENQILDIDSLTKLKISKNIPILLLAHNSFFDLNEQQQDRIRAFIRINKNVCAYLCGDTHIEGVKQIDFGTDQNEQIPCIISYKSAPDPMDTYSRFGIIVCDWEKRNATLRGWYWQSREGFKVDNSIFEKTIDMKRESLDRGLFTIFCDSDILIDCENWKLIGKSVEEQKAKNLELSMKRYLIGYPCTWTLAFSNMLVIRKQINSLKLKIQEGGIIALLGAGAEGKSTLMRQLCVQLYQEGYFILFHNQGGNYNLPNQLPDNTILVVDDPDEGRFVQLLNQVYENGITLFFTARYNEWILLCERYNITSDVRRAITIIEMEKITDKQEAGAFADCILRYYKPKANKEEIEQIFLHNSGEYGFLYAAMLLVIYDKIKLEEIAADMVKNK